MMSVKDFSKKQIIFVMFNEGEKISFNNDNLVVKSADGKTKLQCTCYRLFIVFAVGHCTITSVLLQKAKKFGFFIALMSPGFRLYDIIGAKKDGNTMLRRKQYGYDGLDIAKHITINKISNQKAILQKVRNKSEAVSEAIELMNGYCNKIPEADTLSGIMSYEGLASKVYFKAHFNNIQWNGRQPRIKKDPVNSVLDIGYTILFTYIDALLCCYGFDTYCGVMHRQFYMRKSLVCDLVEPFRPIIDHTVKKAINLKQIKDDDFTVINNQYKLKWDVTPKYVKLLITPLIEIREDIFKFIQEYYRAFMKGLTADEYPYFDITR